MYILGAVLEKNQAKVALYDKNYNLLLKKEGTCTDLSKICMDTISEVGVKPADVVYIGIAADGNFNINDVLTDLENNTGIKCISAPVICARTLGEAYISNDIPSLFMLKIDDTVESAVVIDKKIYSGIGKPGDNIAHMVINNGGFECTCGRKGCFEAYASNTGLRRIAALSGVDNADSITHKELFEMNTPAAEQAKKLYVEYLASGITDIINLYQTHELVLDGPFTKVGDTLTAPMIDIINRKQYTKDSPNKCKIRYSDNDDDTVLIGAALLGR